MFFLISYLVTRRKRKMRLWVPGRLSVALVFIKVHMGDLSCLYLITRP